MFGRKRAKEQKNIEMKLEWLTMRFENHLKWSAQALSPAYFQPQINEIESMIKTFERVIQQGPSQHSKKTVSLLEAKISAFEIAFHNEKEKIGKQPGFHRGMTRIELKKIENDIKEVYFDFLYTLEPRQAYGAKKVYLDYLKHLSILSEETYNPTITSYNYFKVEMEKIKTDSFDYINNFQTV